MKLGFRQEGGAASLPRAIKQRGLVVCALLASMVAVTCSSMNQGDRKTKVKTVPLTRVVRIPVTNASSGADGDEAQRESKALLVSEGGTDELPEGSAAFDVLDDGSFLLADPLRERLAIFNPQGAFKRALSIGIACDDVTITPDKLIEVRDASTGETRFFDTEGHPREGQIAAPQTVEAYLLTETSGTVTRSGRGGQTTVQIKFEKPGLRLLSIENLATDQEGNTYVALEATPGGDMVEVSKYVQKYSADGKLVCEVENIPLDYYVSPVNELRVRKGTLYQLKTTRSEIQINEWDLH